MENRQATLFSLQEIAKRDLSTLQADILRVLSLGNADEAALQLDFFCPPLAQGGEVTAYLWAIWDVVIDVVRSPDTTSEIHEHIVSILQSLIPIRKGEILAWNVSIDLWPLSLAWLLVSWKQLRGADSEHCLLIVANSRQREIFGRIYLYFLNAWSHGSIVCPSSMPT